MKERNFNLRNNENKPKSTTNFNKNTLQRFKEIHTCRNDKIMRSNERSPFKLELKPLLESISPFNIYVFYTRSNVFP